jgi:hypothetical protein
VIYRVLPDELIFQIMSITAHEAHTLVITEDSPEPALIMFVVEGGLIYLDKPVNGSVAAYEDGFTALELTRKYYREAGLDARELDLLVR